MNNIYILIHTIRDVICIMRYTSDEVMVTFLRTKQCVLSNAPRRSAFFLSISTLTHNKHTFSPTCMHIYYSSNISSKPHANNETNVRYRRSRRIDRRLAFFSDHREHIVAYRSSRAWLFYAAPHQPGISSERPTQKCVSDELMHTRCRARFLDIMDRFQEQECRCYTTLFDASLSLRCAVSFPI